MRKFGCPGFTLAELLIALAILGVIATFTIPKILTANQNQQYNAVAKEDIAMVAGAFQQAQLSGAISAGTKIGDLTSYMNYVASKVTGSVDSINGESNFDCTAADPCLILHNGSALHYTTMESFGGASTTNALWFHIDPNGAYGGTTNGPDKSVGIFLYYNGKMTDEGNLLAGTTSSAKAYASDSSKVPSWFSW